MLEDFHAAHCRCSLWTRLTKLKASPRTSWPSGVWLLIIPITLSIQKRVWWPRDLMTKRSSLDWSSTGRHLCRLCRHHSMCWSTSCRLFRKQLEKKMACLLLPNQGLPNGWATSPSHLSWEWGKMTTFRPAVIWCRDSSWSWFWVNWRLVCPTCTMTNWMASNLVMLNLKPSQFKDLPLHHPVNLAWSCYCRPWRCQYDWPGPPQTYGETTVSYNLGYQEIFLSWSGC